jgi:hypothetical protein
MTLGDFRLRHEPDQPGRSDNVRYQGKTASRVSASSGPFWILGVAAMIQRFARVTLQEIGIDCH